DWRFSLLSLVAEGDRVVAHIPYSGTHRGGVIAGVEPTGRSCTVDEIVIFRIADGKIAEAWEVFDEAGMWRQLGVLRPESATAPSKGSDEDRPARHDRSLRPERRPRTDADRGQDRRRDPHAGGHGARRRHRLLRPRRRVRRRTASRRGALRGSAPADPRR